MLADQIIQPVHCFDFGNVEFHRRFADDPRIRLTEMPLGAAVQDNPIGTLEA